MRFLVIPLVVAVITYLGTFREEFDDEKITKSLLFFVAILALVILYVVLTSL